MKNVFKIFSIFCTCISAFTLSLSPIYALDNVQEEKIVKLISIDPRGVETYTVTRDDGSNYGYVRWIATFNHYPNGMTKFVRMNYKNHFHWEWPLYKVSSFYTDIPEGSDVTGLSRMVITYNIYTGAGVNINGVEFIFTF